MLQTFLKNQKIDNKIISFVDKTFRLCYRKNTALQLIFLWTMDLITYLFLFLLVLAKNVNVFLKFSTKKN